MKSLLLLCAVFIMLAPNCVFGQCGVERWSVKTGTDADAGMVNLSSSTATTISNLSALPAPASLPDNNRIQPTETTVWVLNATLVKYEKAFDSDYHMVLSDDAGHTMIAEIPDPQCVGSGSPLAAGIAHARAQFNAMFSATNSFQMANVPVKVTGVGFFDFIEGQEGVAPNAIELHPVIDIQFGPSFALQSAPFSLTIAQGGMNTATITSEIGGGFNSLVALSVSGLPTGASAGLSPTTIPAPGSGASTLSFTVGPSTPVGTYNITVTGSGGSQSHATTINLTVITGSGTVQQLLGNPGFENGSTNPSPWVVTSGVVDNSSSKPPHTGTWKAWLDGYGSTHTDTIYQPVTIPSTATQAQLVFWLHVDTAETSTTTAYDTLKVQVRNSSGSTILSTVGSYSNLNATSAYQQVSFDLSAYKGQSIRIYLVGTEDSSLQTSFVLDDFALYVTTGSVPSDFAISSSPSAVTVVQGNSGTSTVSTTVSGGFNSAVTLSASGLPTGATASFSPSSIAAPGNGSSTLTIAAASSTATGTYNVSVTATGGGMTHTTTVSLTVGAGSGGGTTQQLLANPGFENGANATPWTVTSGVIDNSTSQPAHSGAWKAWLDGYGTTHTDTLVQTVAIPSTATAAGLSFWLRVTTAETTTTIAYDTLKVQIRNSSATVLATLATYSNLNASSGYNQVSFDLSSYRGQTVQIYLIGVEDSSLQTSFFVDDFALNVTTP